jgi:hypothetical protein
MFLRSGKFNSLRKAGAVGFTQHDRLAVKVVLLEILNVVKFSLG